MPVERRSPCQGGYFGQCACGPSYLREYCLVWALDEPRMMPVNVINESLGVIGPRRGCKDDASDTFFQRGSQGVDD